MPAISDKSVAVLPFVGYHQWSETYDRVLDDIFKVQDEIAAAVVKAMKLKLLPDHMLLSAGDRAANLAPYFIVRSLYPSGLTVANARDVIHQQCLLIFRVVQQNSKNCPCGEHPNRPGMFVDNRDVFEASLLHPRRDVLQ